MQDALAGHVKLHAQPGHPHGIHSHHYAAELALGQVLLDPGGELAALKARLGSYPAALKAALIAHYAWQPDFWLYGAAKGLGRGDLHYAQGNTYQAVMAMVQTLCARGERVADQREGGGGAGRSRARCARRLRGAGECGAGWPRSGRPANARLGPERACLKVALTLPT